MKYTCIAALALAWATFSPAPAQAHDSNCTALNGPYCEMAHNYRHHNMQWPITWPQTYNYPYYGGMQYPGTGGYYGMPGYANPYLNNGCGAYGGGYGGYGTYQGYGSYGSYGMYGTMPTTTICGTTSPYYRGF